METEKVYLECPLGVSSLRNNANGPQKPYILGSWKNFIICGDLTNGPDPRDFEPLHQYAREHRNLFFGSLTSFKDYLPKPTKTARKCASGWDLYCDSPGSAHHGKKLNKITKDKHCVFVNTFTDAQLEMLHNAAEQKAGSSKPDKFSSISRGDHEAHRLILINAANCSPPAVPTSPATPVVTRVQSSSESEEDVFKMVKARGEDLKTSKKRLADAQQDAEKAQTCLKQAEQELEACQKNFADAEAVAWKRYKDDLFKN